MRGAASLLAIALLAEGPTVSAAVKEQGAPESPQIIGATIGARNGISAYTVTEQGKGRPVVHLLGQEGNQIAAIEYDLQKTGFIEAHYTGNNGDRVVVYWNTLIGNLEILLPDGRQGAWQFDATRKEWAPSGAATLAEVSGPLQLVAGASQDLFGDQGRACVSLLSESDQLLGGAASGRRSLENPPCRNPYQVQSDIYALSKAVACEQATLAANTGCNNQYCLGCCQVSACSCICALGEFYCACQVLGKPCAPPDPPPPPRCADGSNYCPDEQGQGYCDLNPEDPWCTSPIVFDLDRRGFEFTGGFDSVLFDIDGDQQLERVTWTARDRNEAFLTLDVNDNGRIDSGRELFGNVTLLPAGHAAVNGYAALAQYDRLEQGGNADGVIDGRDAIYRYLRLWVDRNHDGASQAGELLTLQEAGVVRIDLSYEKRMIRDRFGNVLRFWGKAWIETPHGERKIDTVDVYFVRGGR